MLNVYAHTQVKVAGERVDMVICHSGYFPWNHGKFICKGEGKWSCSGLRSYRSYGSEAMGWPYEQAQRLPHRFRPTPLVASRSMIFYYHLLLSDKNVR